MFDIFSKPDPRSSMTSNVYNSFIGNVSLSLTVQMNKLLEPLSVKDMEQTLRKSEHFFKTIDAWRALQSMYITKLKQIQTTFKQKALPQQKPSSSNSIPLSQQPQTKPASQQIDTELIQLFEALINHHRNLSQKITCDICEINLSTFQTLSKEIKEIVAEEKSCIKQMNSVKEQLEKVLSKKTKLRRQKEEELMLKIFMEDGSQDFMMDQKLKKLNKYNQIKKQLNEYQIKVSQSVDQYQRSSQNLKKNHLQYYQKIDRLTQCRYQTVTKMQLHLLTFYKNAAQGISAMTKEIEVFMDQNNDGIIEQPNGKRGIFDEMERKNKENKNRIEENRRSQFQILDKLIQNKVGYVQYSLKLIDQKQFDQLLFYSKDRDIKTRIKKMIESNEIDPTDTDQTCRQIQLIKKVIRSNTQETESMGIFRSMVQKNSKLRMNFIFLLQFLRINGIFQLTLGQFRPIYRLINQFIEACHDNRDCFVLKQLMILLTTYYVTLQDEQKEKEKKQSQTTIDEPQLVNPSVQDKSPTESPIQLSQIKQSKKKPSTSSTSPPKQKIYILQFFKSHQLWHDIEFWQSLLIQCIYSQKRNTIKNLVRGLESTQKKEMMQAEKTSILNQILYVVRNMIIFDFTEKDVKNFGLRFCKLLKLEDRSVKDVYRTIEEAIKEEGEMKQCESIEKYREMIENRLV